MIAEYSRKVCISTNANCNLECVYCYEKNKSSNEFDVSEALSVLDGILIETTEKGTKIKLHGGEPFLVFNKIREFCESLWSKSYPEYYHIHITTNGTLVHGEIQEWLSRNSDKITVKLSLDGNKKTSDINRPKSFDKIDIPFFVRTWPELRVNMTMTPSSLPFLAENIKFIHSVGIKHILTHFALMTDWSGGQLYKVYYNQLLELVRYYLDNPNIEPCGLFNKDISMTLLDTRSCYPCNVGQMKAFDFQTKKYYPCYMCFPSVGGNNVAEQLERINFLDKTKLEEETCLKCPFINVCVTCYAENYISRGSISRRDMGMCPYQKITFALLFKYEYYRILKLEEPQDNDIRKMMAIQKLAKEVEEIENWVTMKND